MRSSSAYKSLTETVDLLKANLMSLLDYESNLLDIFIIPKRRPILVGLPPEKVAGPTRLPKFKPNLCPIEFFCQSNIEWPGLFFTKYSIKNSSTVHLTAFRTTFLYPTIHCRKCSINEAWFHMQFYFDCSYTTVNFCEFFYSTSLSFFTKHQLFNIVKIFQNQIPLQ